MALFFFVFFLRRAFCWRAQWLPPALGPLLPADGFTRKAGGFVRIERQRQALLRSRAFVLIDRKTGLAVPFRRTC